MPATVDRGEILHLAGRRRLSPALRDGAPAFLPTSETAGRCGWAPFFAALDAARGAVSYEGPEEGPLTVVPRT